MTGDQQLANRTGDRPKPEGHLTELVTIGAKIAIERRQSVDRLAARMGCSRSDCIRRAVEEFLQNHDGACNEARKPALTASQVSAATRYAPSACNPKDAGELAVNEGRGADGRIQVWLDNPIKKFDSE